MGPQTGGSSEGRRLTQEKKASGASNSSKEPSVIGESISIASQIRKITEENPTEIFGERRAETMPSRIGSKARVSIFQSLADVWVHGSCGPDVRSSFKQPRLRHLFDPHQHKIKTIG
jgi:hypothetical protein